MGRDVCAAERFSALVVRDQERLVAALPLVHTRLYGVLSASTIPSNGWLPTGGGLLFDRETATDDVMDLLVGATASLPRQVLWLDEVALGVPRWQAFWNAVDRAGMPVSFQERYPVGRIEIDHDWEAYRASWSQGHRYNMRRASRKLATHGEAAIRDGCAISSRTRWNGNCDVDSRSRTAVGRAQSRKLGVRSRNVSLLRSTGEAVGVWGQLRLAFLTLDARPIAFCYCFAAKGVCHTLKPAYDPEFAAFSPGQLLFHDLLEQLFHDPWYCAVDTVGLLTDTVAHWRPRTYTVGIAMIAPRRDGRTTGDLRPQALVAAAAKTKSQAPTYGTTFVMLTDDAVGHSCSHRSARRRAGGGMERTG